MATGDKVLPGSLKANSGFYFNDDLGLPTIISKFGEVEEILERLQYMACITVQISHLSKIEYLYGSVVYIDLLKSISKVLMRIRDEELRHEDIFVLDIFDTDSFIIFLSAPRNDKTQLLQHLEAIAERVRVNIEQKVFETFYPYLKENARPGVGFALVIKNPMVNNLRLLNQLITSAKKMGEFMSIKQDHYAKFNLQKIIIEQQIETLFQPIVATKDLSILGYEALSRGPIGTEFRSPKLLFLIAAECGLSFELDRLCRKKALAKVRDMGINKKIFVNTLTMTIHDPEFRGVYLNDLLQDLKLKPENVVFEVSERLAIDNYEIFRVAMKDYKDIGIVQAHDDIGKGYSDLERVMELHPGFMKVDISFVRDVHKSFIKQEIIKSMLALANGIGSEIIAEGVESREEFDTLRELGVTYVQGFLFGQPVDELKESIGTLPARKG